MSDGERAREKERGWPLLRQPARPIVSWRWIEFPPAIKPNIREGKSIKKKIQIVIQDTKKERRRDKIPITSIIPVISRGRPMFFIHDFEDCSVLRRDGKCVSMTRVMSNIKHTHIYAQKKDTSIPEDIQRFLDNGQGSPPGSESLIKGATKDARFESKFWFYIIILWTSEMRRKEFRGWYNENEDAIIKQQVA